MTHAETCLALALDVGHTVAWESAPGSPALRLTGPVHEVYGVEVAGLWSAIDALVHPDDRDPYRAARGRASERGEYAITFRIVDPATGAVRTLEERARLVGGGHGIVGVAHLARAADAETSPPAAALNAAQELQALLDVIPVGVFTAHDPECLFISGNRAGAEMLRLPTLDANASKSAPGEHLPFRTFRDEVEVPPDQLPMQRCCATGQPIHGEELQVVFPDAVTTLHLSVAPLSDAAGRVRGCIGAFVDITARKRTEEALQRSERLYRAIGESIDYGIWVCDREGRNTYASDSFLRLVGITQAECSAFGWGRALHPDDLADTIAAWQHCVRTGTFWEREHRFRGVDGEYHHVLARGVPIRDTHGEIECWAGINLDISALKRAEDALRQVAHRKDIFLATLAHELRNPLAPLRSATEVLQGLPQADPRVAWAAGVLDRQLTHLTRLIDDLLDISRIRRGAISLRTELLALGAAVEQALETCRPLLVRLGHRVDVDLPAAPVFVTADPTRIVQVVANLINNAGKYTPPGGHIRVTVTRDGDEAVVSVLDDGIGIHPDKLHEIFEMFAQVDTSLERSQGGLGIGLTIARLLVQLHGGTLSAHSRGEGQGSEFVVRLPAREAPAATRTPSPPARPATLGRRILIVDDNIDSAESLRLLLELEGHEAHVAHDGPSALAFARRLLPELILLDLGMPGMSGYEVAAAVRRELDPNITLIAVTGWGQAEDRRRTHEAGFDHHLVKPLHFEQLRPLLSATPRG